MPGNAPSATRVRVMKLKAFLILSISVASVACAPQLKRSSTTSTTIGTVALKEQWAPERGVNRIEVTRDGAGFVLHVDATLVCRVWGAEQQIHQHTWESTPNTGAVVGELVMVGAGVGTVLTAWAMTKDDCGSSDVLSSCDEYAQSVSLIGVGVAVAGATALTVDLLSSDRGGETKTSLGRAIPPRYAVCEKATIEGWVAKLVAPNVTLSLTLDRGGDARFDVPEHAWPRSGVLDMDVVLGDRVAGRAVLRKEAP